jgi:hypothetical protein
LRPLVNSSAIVLDYFGLGFVDPLGFLKRPFGFCDCLLLQLPPLLPRRLFLPARGLTPLLLSLSNASAASLPALASILLTVDSFFVG